MGGRQGSDRKIRERGKSFRYLRPASTDVAAEDFGGYKKLFRSLLRKEREERNERLRGRAPCTMVL